MMVMIKHKGGVKFVRGVQRNHTSSLKQVEKKKKITQRDERKQYVKV